MLWNLITNINQGIKLKKKFIIIKNTKMVCKVLDSLWNENIISGYVIHNKNIFVKLKYNMWGDCSINKIKLISTPGRCVFLNNHNKFLSKNIIYIIATSKGIFSKKFGETSIKFGGELLLKVYI